MATAARRLQWLLLFVSFSAVLQPTWTRQLYPTDHESMRTGFWQPDGAGGASSIWGLNFPVWCLLVHFWSTETMAGRSAIRRMHTSLENIVSKQTTALRVFLGVGIYFMILLLACADVERHPGPYFSELDKLEMKHSFIREPVVLEDLVAVILELGLDIAKYSDQIVALEAENSRLTSTVQGLEKTLARQDREQRRKNVVLFGVPTKTDLKEAINDVMFKKLSLQKCPHENLIEKAYRFGQDTPHRPILIQFKNEGDKNLVMNLAPNLRSTEIKISDDLTKDERLNRRKIVEAHKAARSEGIETKVMRQGLLVNGEILPASAFDNRDWMEKYLQGDTSK